MVRGIFVFFIQKQYVPFLGKKNTMPTEPTPLGSYEDTFM
jgi:hypothetical protein